MIEIAGLSVEITNAIISLIVSILGSICAHFLINVLYIRLKKYYLKMIKWLNIHFKNYHFNRRNGKKRATVRGNRMFLPRFLH